MHTKDNKVRNTKRDLPLTLQTKAVSLYQDGLTSRQIAAKLGINRKTVMRHVKWAGINPRKQIETSDDPITEFHPDVMMEPNSGCWLWNGNVNNWGYGRKKRNGKFIPIHRLSYEQNIGPIPKGLFVCHRCDVRSCCNPSHLFLGTIDDNNKDTVKKGRHCRGEDSPHTTLTNKQVLKIKAHGFKKRGDNIKLAKKYGVKPHTISSILNGKSWKWLK
jgi:hypothetical protein